MKLKIICHLQKDSSGLSSEYCGPRRHQPPLQAPALPRSWNVIASLCKGSSQWVNKFWDSTVLSCCTEKMCCKRWKHQKSRDCETGKRGIILGERVADLPFPTLSALCPPFFYLLGSRMILCFATWQLWGHPPFPGIEMPELALSPTARWWGDPERVSWKPWAFSLLGRSSSRTGWGSCRKADPRHKTWTEKLKVKY